MNIRYTFAAWKPALAGIVIVTTVVLYGALATPASSSHAAVSAQPLHVTFADARHVIDRRCGACHSASPSDSTFGPAPAGVAFDLPEQIQSHAARIRERAVVTRTMPLGNKTHITEQERAILGAWISEGATIP
jgi:Predicted membrane protein